MASPAKILFTIPNFITAGSGRVMLNILERLDRSKFLPSICVLRRGGKLDAEVERLGIPFFELPFTVDVKPYWSLFERSRRAARAFSPYRFDLWHSFHYAGEYTEPIIARLAGAKAWVYTKKAMGWGSRAWKIRSLLATRIVADNSDMLRVMFERPWFARKVRLIHHGIPSAEYAPTDNRLALRAHLGIGSRQIVVTSVAHLLPVKGHSTLIEALNQMPDAHLLLAGMPLDAEYVQSLHAQVKKYGLEGHVHFLGAVADVPALLSETDIFVLPTWAKWRMEGCPVALLEAMSCGRACIATDIPGSRDLIENGRSGLLVPPENPAALSHALTTLIENPSLRMRLGEAARERVLKHYTIEHEVAAHEQMYSELLG
ncbi:MAG: glycosyltransferase [Bacteroidetes bacterium]|nr:glycosyltransferase [Bacteroidota bacterium]MCW5897448.1 glycosyltransferase [Bacteroidota bacterium]